MLRILKRQMDHFGRLAAQSFEDRVVAHLAETYPDLASRMGLDTLRSRVRAGMTKAERYGVTLEPDALEFILMLLALGPNADEEIPWVRAIVNDRDLSGTGKVRLLDKTARRELGYEEAPA
jgi:hypothetical protein